MDKFNKTHMISKESLLLIVRELKEKIIARGDLPYVSVKKQLEIVDDLSSFPMGNFFLERKGADGFWTNYIINYPENNKEEYNIEGSPLSPTERFILERCPLSLATRERFKIFQKYIQNRLKNNITLASIPCGVMRDLLTLDLSSISKFSLIGIDIDPTSLLLAKQLAEENDLTDHVEFIQRDAWNLQLENQLDIIVSNGLNVYISDRQKIEDLYLQLYKALKNGGVLVIGVLTHPPDGESESEWILEELSDDDIIMERVLFEDILDSKWRNYRSSSETIQDFLAIGFRKVEILFDKYHIFPTIIAEK